MHFRLLARGYYLGLCRDVSPSGPGLSVRVFIFVFSYCFFLLLLAFVSPKEYVQTKIVWVCVVCYPGFT